ncbi:TIGR02234 family membrane protein [Nocardia sp. NPDC003693]
MTGAEQPGTPAPEPAGTPASEQPPADSAPAGQSSETPAAQADSDRPAGGAAEAPARPAPPRSRPIGAVVLLTLAAILLWASSRMTWVSLEVTSELGEPRTIDLDGGTWFGALTPLALVLVATIAAVFAARGWVRRALGAVVAVLAAVAAVPAYAVIQGEGRTAERAAQLAGLRDWEHAGSVQTGTLPAVLTLLGAVAAFAAGVLLARMPAESAQLSGKYDNPVFRKSEAAERVAEHRAETRAAESTSQDPADATLSGRVLWDALDAGTDPTDDDGNTAAAHRDPGTAGDGHKPR